MAPRKTWKRKAPKNAKPKRLGDLDALAKSAVDSAVESGKNPAAVALGRLGGLKGGPARARKLTRQRRQEIARRAAEARWHGGTDEF